MNADQNSAFDLMATRYLDGELDGDGFEQLQDELRESPESRRRFLDLCRHAQECSEVTDRRPELAASAAADRPIARPADWRWQRWAGAAAAAVVLAAVYYWRPSVSEAELAGPGAAKETPGVAVTESRARSRAVSLLELRPPSFVLMPAAVQLLPGWETIDADLGLAKDPDPALSWLDTIGLQVVFHPPEPTRPDDVQL